MRVIKFEGDCIKNMLWFESEKSYIQSEKSSSLTLLLQIPIMFYGIGVIINESNDILRWVHQKYVMIQIRQILYSIRKGLGGGDMTLLLPIIFDVINLTMNKSGEVQR